MLALAGLPFLVQSSPHAMHGDGSDQPDTTVGGYRIERLIGNGGMAAVYEARRLGRTGPGERVACKVMHTGARIGPDERELMRNEAMLGLRFGANRPNLVPVLDYFDDAHDRRCLVMELVDGASVDELCGPDRLLPVPVVRRIASEVLVALDQLHSLGVLHRDLAPGNIMVTTDGAVKLVDLGLARQMEQGAVHTLTLRATPMYACPEAVQLRPTDVRSDLFTLAAVLYELLSGVPPAGKRNATFSILARILQDDFAPLPEDTPDDLVELVMGMLQFDPGARWPQSAAEALELLDLREEPMASEEELAALVAAARPRHEAALASFRPDDELPPGYVLMPRDRVAKPGRHRGKVRLRVRHTVTRGRLLTRRVLAAAGIVTALASCALVLGLLLHGGVGDEPGAAELAESRDAPAVEPTLAAPVAPPVPSAPPAVTSAVPSAPPAVSAAPSAPPAVSAAPSAPPAATLGAPVIAQTPSSAPPVVTSAEPGAPAAVARERAAETTAPRADSRRATGAHRRRIESQRGARRTGAAPSRWAPEPVGSEPPSWRTP
jgi:hypothetical protein